MAVSSTRITRPAEDVDGYAVVTIRGLSAVDPGAEFAVRRHGFGDGHLGPSGWGRSENWFAAGSAWQADRGWKLLLSPEITRWLQEMPLELVVRVPGVVGERSFTVVWPAELSEVPEEVLPWDALQAGAESPAYQPTVPRRSGARWPKALAVLFLLLIPVLVFLYWTQFRPRLGSSQVESPIESPPRTASPEPASRQAPPPPPSISPDSATTAAEEPVPPPAVQTAAPVIPADTAQGPDLETDLKAALGEKLESELERRMRAAAQVEQGSSGHREASPRPQ